MLVLTPTPSAGNVTDLIQTQIATQMMEVDPELEFLPIFKGFPGERPDAHLLAAEDWMEAMRVKPDDYIDTFKHTYSIWLMNGTMA